MININAGSPARYSAIFFFLRGFKLLYGVILVLTLATAVLESVSVAAFFPLFSSVLGTTEENMGGVLGFITSIGDLLPFSDPIVSAAVLLILVFLVRTLLTLAREALVAYAAAKALYRAKKQIMERYAGAHYQFFLDSRQGTLIYSSVSAPSAVGNLLYQGPQLVAHVLKALSITIIMGLIFWEGAVGLVILGAVFYAVIHYLSKRISYELGRRRTQSSAEQAVITNEFLSGIRQILTLGATRSWTERFDLENRIYSEIYAKDRVWVATPRPLMELSAVTLMLGFLLALRLLSPSSFVDAFPTLGVFAVALVQLLPSVTTVGRIRMGLMGALPDMELAYRSITETPLRRSDGHEELDSFEKVIAFENVSFAYKERQLLLDGATMTFDKGKVTAIVGPSGAGKTTIVNLILGLFEPSKGRITIDGVPLEELKQDTWLSKIGFVSQEPFTYHSSVADNIRFGRNGHSMESVIEASKTANAHGFISELPEGYDTIAGERGMKLSGGQQQRVNIARAVLDSPEILIFDEATSSLDTISEKMVQEAIDRVSGDRTVIIVAHRLSTVRRADKIIVIDDGRVMEQGSHEELLSKDGHYSRLVASGR